MLFAAVVASRSFQQICEQHFDRKFTAVSKQTDKPLFTDSVCIRGDWFIYEKETEEKNRSPLLFSHLTNSNSNFNRIEMNWIEFKTSGVSAMTLHYISALIFMNSRRLLTTCRPSLFHSEKHPCRTVCCIYIYSTCGQLRVGTQFFLIGKFYIT